MSNSNKYIKFESVDRCITKYTYKGKHPRFRVRCKHKGIGTFDTLEEAKQCRDNYEFGNLKRTGKYRCHEIYGNSRQTIIEKYKKLQEQLNEANELIKDYIHDAKDCFTIGRINRYKEKWGVK